MPDTDLKALTEDIKKHGQRDRGVMYEGMVLDGWHRYPNGTGLRAILPEGQ